MGSTQGPSGPFADLEKFAFDLSGGDAFFSISFFITFKFPSHYESNLSILRFRRLAADLL